MFIDSYLVRAVNILLVFGIMFLLYGIVFGESGVLRKNALQQQLYTEKQRLSMLKQDNLQKEHRISLLRENNMDLDMLEEQNRRLFNTSKQGEIQVVLD